MKPASSVLCGLVLSVAAGLASAPAQAEPERFTVVSGGETVGRLNAEVGAGKADIDYQVINNGRGPHFTEHLTLDGDGLPASWTVDGQTAFGGKVHERLTRAGGVTSWESEADHGEAATPKPRLYVADDASPWSLGVYARALLKAPGHALDVLPGGTLRLEELRTIELGKDAAKLKLTAYFLSGLDTAPKLVLLDEHQRLFAYMIQDPGNPPALLIREGYEAEAGRIGLLGLELQDERQKALQQKLAHHFTQPVRIKNVRIFDPKAEQMSGPMDVVVSGDRITTVEPDRPDTPRVPGEVVIDGQGGALLPGLHDMHSHTNQQSGLLYLAAGVTATRDMGNNNAFLQNLIDEHAKGEIAGPRIIRNGLIDGRSPYSVRTGVIADSLADGLADVRWYADHGYWQIKIYNSMKPEWVKPIADEAHAHGMRVTGHIPAFMTADEVIGDGYNELTHLNLLMLSWLIDPTKEDTRTSFRITALSRAANLDLDSPKVAATVALMKERHIPLDPTAVIIERLMLARAGVVAEADKPYLDHMPVGYQRYRKRSFIDASDPKVDQDFRKGFANGLKVLALLDRNGIQLLPGTDDPSGFTLHRELELYVKAGLAPAKVLRMDTLDCERYFGRDQELGSIERGKIADLILVDGDPTKNISDVRKVRMTVADGVVYFPSEIYSALDVRPFAAAPPVVRPQESAK